MSQDAVRPDEHADPVAAVRSAHRRGLPLSLATAGTTATSRRVRRTTASWWGSFATYADLTGVRAGARVWLPGPTTSTMVLFAAVHAAESGAVLVSDPAQATHACLTPAQLWQHATRLAPGTIVTTAGAAQPEAVTTLAQERRLDLRTYYGAAELSFVAADPDGGGLRAFDQVELSVRDGVVWVRSPWLSDGYDDANTLQDVNAPRLHTSRTPGGRTPGGRTPGSHTPSSFARDADGWASVGDLGRLDEHGVLTILGRPEAITTAGATVLIADIEALLAPAASAPFAVHEVSHPTLGAVVAVTVTASADRERLLSYAKTHLPATHRPRVARHTDQLPLTPAGKLDRAALSLADHLPGRR